MVAAADTGRGGAVSDRLLGLEDQKEGGLHCAGCGVPVGPHNDSGWKVFVKGGVQPLCGVCEFTYGPKPGEKVHDKVSD